MRDELTLRQDVRLPKNITCDLSWYLMTGWEVPQEKELSEPYHRHMEFNRYTNVDKLNES